MYASNIPAHIPDSKSKLFILEFDSLKLKQKCTLHTADYCLCASCMMEVADWLVVHAL